MFASWWHSHVDGASLPRRGPPVTGHSQLCPAMAHAPRRTVARTGGMGFQGCASRARMWRRTAGKLQYSLAHGRA